MELQQDLLGEATRRETGVLGLFGLKTHPPSLLAMADRPFSATRRLLKGELPNFRAPAVPL